MEENLKIQASRKIIHIDMDAFFASVEQRDNPELRGKPIAVGGGSKRGVVAAASYEARKFGVRSAMPSIKAKSLCKDLIFVKGRFDAYKEASKKIREIFHEYTDLVEPLSLDEAYLDVTENKKNISSAIYIAREIRKKIKAELNLTASAGISYNKFLAKTASDVNKPDGLTAILPHQAEAFLENLPIERFYGIGKVTAEKMKRLGIFRGRDLKMWKESELVHSFGKYGKFYYYIVRGIDNRKVSPHRERKSIGAERTFFDDLKTVEGVHEKIISIKEELVKRMKKINTIGKTLTLKIKYHDFTVLSRSKTFMHPLVDPQEIEDTAFALFKEFEEDSFKIRLLGLSISNLVSQENIQGKQLEIKFKNQFPSSGSF